MILVEADFSIFELRGWCVSLRSRCGDETACQTPRMRMVDSNLREAVATDCQWDGQSTLLMFNLCVDEGANKVDADQDVWKLVENRGMSEAIGRRAWSDYPNGASGVISLSYFASKYTQVKISVIWWRSASRVLRPSIV